MLAIVPEIKLFYPCFSFLQEHVLKKDTVLWGKKEGFRGERGGRKRKARQGRSEENEID